MYAPGKKPFPLMVTVSGVPAGHDAGLRVVTAGGGVLVISPEIVLVTDVPAALLENCRAFLTPRYFTFAE